jgi:hypothetical protein
MTVRKVIRSTTGDRGPPEGGVVIHTVEQLGPNMSLLPNGSLLCRNVPLARTGWMMYGPGETPIKCGSGTDVAYVQRTEQTLFDPACLSSFVGASIVDEHPNDDVTPANWKQLAKGTVLTARRGEGDDKDLVIGDVLVTDAGLIASIQAGKREVSAGYDADYEQISDGVGQQTNIIVNHIALVERGRCGPRCAIGDREYQPPAKKGQPSMATKRVQIKTGARRVTLDALRQKVADAEEALQNAEAEEGSVEDLGDGNPSGDTHIHIHTSGDKPDAGETNDGGEEEQASGGGNIEARIAAIEQSITQLTQTVAQLAGGGDADTQDDGGNGDPESDVNGGPADEESVATGDDGNPFAKKDDEDDKSGKTMDSAALEKGYATLLAKAEVLVPGFRVPTFDAKALRKTTVDSMCSLRRKVVDAAYMTKDGATLINGITGRDSLNLVKMGCADVAVLFNAASAAKAAINNAGATRDSATQAAQPAAKGLPSIAEINKANKEFWAKQGAPR